MVKKFTTLLASWLFFIVITAITPAAHADLNLELPDLNLPDIGVSTATVSQDNTLGLKILRNFRNKLPVVEDPELNSWIRSIGNRLANKAPTHNKLYFLLVKDPEVNAFATPGGVIVINTGLILQSDSESEVAAVVAHEIAHITQNHISRMIAKSKSNVLGTGAAILAGLAAGSQNPEAGSAIISTAIAAQQHKQLAFSRAMEGEADRVGIRILASAGFKAEGMPNFMGKLDRLNDNPNAQLTKYLQSHPLSIERLSDTRSRAQHFGHRGRNNADFLFIREKIRGLMSTGLQATTPPLPTKQLTSYSQAIKLIAQGKTSTALRILPGQPTRLPVKLALAQAYNGSQHYQQTIKLLTPAAQIHPGEPAILVPLANALLATGQVAKAWQYLKNTVTEEQTSLVFFEVKQEAARRMGYIADAYLASANRNLRIGEKKLAITQLQQAIKQPDLSAQDIARLQSSLHQMQQ